MPNGPQKVLVVDDLQDWRITLCGLLEDHSYEVEMAGSFAEATTLIKTNCYDLILVDLRLDETDERNIDGLRLAENVKGQWPEVKVVMITGFVSPDIINQGMGMDTDGVRLLADFVRKDEINKLVEIIQRVLSR